MFDSRWNNSFYTVNLVAYLINVSLNLLLLFSTPMLKRLDKMHYFLRTESGAQLQCKMAGLKNYIKEYSLLEKKNLKDVNLWEDYLIYAIIFDIKGVLDKDSKELYYKLTK